MISQLERLKERSIQFTIEIIQRRLSDDLVESLIQLDEKFRDSVFLYKDIENKNDLKSLKELIYSNREKLSEELFDDCKEELKEIGEDIKWKNSKDGKRVLELEDWVLTTREILKANDFKNIFIGRDFIDPLVLIISGVVANEMQAKKLKEKIKELNPPAQPKYIIELPE